MGITRSEIFTEHQNELALIFKAFAHPARIAILQQIIKAKACICTDLVVEIGLAQSTISQHLKELKNSGLIKGNIEGTSICYCIDENKWNEVKMLYDDFFKSNVHFNKCC